MLDLSLLANHYTNQQSLSLDRSLEWNAFVSFWRLTIDDGCGVDVPGAAADSVLVVGATGHGRLVQHIDWYADCIHASVRMLLPFSRHNCIPVSFRTHSPTFNLAKDLLGYKRLYVISFLFMYISNALFHSVHSHVSTQVRLRTQIT